jgi:hypothetical protein
MCSLAIRNSTHVVAVQYVTRSLQPPGDPFVILTRKVNAHLMRENSQVGVDGETLPEAISP